MKSKSRWYWAGRYPRAVLEHNLDQLLYSHHLRRHHFPTNGPLPRLPTPPPPLPPHPRHPRHLRRSSKYWFRQRAHLLSRHRHRRSHGTSFRQRRARQRRRLGVRSKNSHRTRYYAIRHPPVRSMRPRGRSIWEPTVTSTRPTMAYHKSRWWKDASTPRSTTPRRLRSTDDEVASEEEAHVDSSSHLDLGPSGVLAAGVAAVAATPAASLKTTTRGGRGMLILAAAAPHRQATQEAMFHTNWGVYSSNVGMCVAPRSLLGADDLVKQ